MEQAAARHRVRRILGIDPGLRHTGWGVIEVEGNRLHHVADGAVHSTDEGSLSDRLCQLHAALSAVLERYRPDEAAVEETFVNANAASALKLGHARAVALLVPAQAGLPVAEYPNNQVKKAVVGQGRAEKTQVQAMVRLLLPGCALTTADAADALAIAICHAHHRSSLSAWTPAAESAARHAAAPRRVAEPPRMPTLAAAPADSAEVEALLWSRLRNAQLGAQFRRGEPILGYTAAFVAHDCRLIVEIDPGAPGDAGAEAGERRGRLFEQAGFRVLRFWSSEVSGNVEGVLERIGARLREPAVPGRPVGGAAR